MECAGGGSDCSIQCASRMRYLMCGGTSWAVPIECGKKQGPNCKRTKKNVGCWQCIGSVGMGPLCDHFIWVRNSNICKVVAGSC